MQIQTRVLIIIVGLFCLIQIVNMIKKDKLELKYSLLWIAAIFTICIMAIVPSTIDLLAKILHIASPINSIFFVAICFVLGILFSHTITQSRNSKKIKDIAQEVALLEHELKKSDKILKDEKESKHLEERIG